MTWVPGVAVSVPSKSKKITETSPLNNLRSPRAGSGVRGVNTNLYGLELHDCGVRSPKLNDLCLDLCGGVVDPAAGNGADSCMPTKASPKTEPGVPLFDMHGEGVARLRGRHRCCGPFATSPLKGSEAASHALALRSHGWKSKADLLLVDVQGEGVSNLMGTTRLRCFGASHNSTLGGCMTALATVCAPGSTVDDKVLGEAA